MKLTDIFARIVANHDAGRDIFDDLKFPPECDRESMTLREVVAIAEQVKLKPRETRMLNGVEVPVPLDVRPVEGTEYWFEKPTECVMCDSHVWAGDIVDERIFNMGLCYASAEDAAKNCKARYGVEW